MGRTSGEQLAAEIGVERTDSLKKSGDKYIHKLKMVYDEPRVKLWKANWKQTISNCEANIKSHKDMVDSTVNQFNSEFDKALQKRKEEFQELMSLSKEDLSERLIKDFHDSYESFLEELETVDDLRGKQIAKIKEELDKQKNELMKEKAEKENALHFWNNPKV